MYTISRDGQDKRMIILYAIFSCDQPLFTLYFSVWEILQGFYSIFHSLSLSLSPLSLSLFLSLSLSLLSLPTSLYLSFYLSFSLSPLLSLSFSLAYLMDVFVLVFYDILVIFSKKSLVTNDMICIMYYVWKSNRGITT